MFQFSKERDRSLSMISTKMILATILLILLIGNPTKGKQTVQSVTCLPGCSCRKILTWTESDCSGASFDELPVNFLQGINTLDMSNNNLTRLKKNEFEQRNFINLTLLSLTRCKIQKIHVRAFHAMVNLLILDLSENNISALEIGTFDPITDLSLLLLNKNNLTVLSSGLFNNFQNLKVISLSNNQLTTIEPRAFFNLTVIDKIHLDFNHLSVLKRDSFQQLSSNLIFQLNNNSWNCDCKLKEFYDFAKTTSGEITECKGPERLANREWRKLNSDEFACDPRIVKFVTNYINDSNSTYIEMICGASGIPQPKIYWMEESQEVNEHTTFYNVTRGNFWVNLKILDTPTADDRHYTCVAENPAASVQITNIISGQSKRIVIARNY